ncbi:hypothetical protein CGI94_22910 [Vibrio parahaemolyticus]|nr:hypothetical protein CGI94_22910 [Vibrio parahaemolyticus]
MTGSIVERVKLTILFARWCLVAYSAIVIVGFFLIPFPDWVMAPALCYTQVIKSILFLVLPEGVSAAIAIFVTILTPGFIIIYSSPEERER